MERSAGRGRFRLGRAVAAAAAIPVALAAGVTSPAYGGFAGGNGRIAFEHASSNGMVNIWTMTADGADKRPVSTPSGIEFNDAAWSPDGKRLAARGAPVVFASKRSVAVHAASTGAGDIYVMNADGSHLVDVTNSSAEDRRPAWSPDGSKIAFTSNRDGDENVYVMNADESDPKALTTDQHNDSEPSWSPDGKRIAFNSDRGGDADVWLIDLATRKATDIVNSPPSTDLGPDWSPDGKSIVFWSDRDTGAKGIGQIYKITQAGGSFVGGAQVRLTHDDSSDFSPAWSPDGKRIAFDSARDGNFEVYTMNADGSDQANVTDDPAYDAVPDWQPRPGRHHYRIVLKAWIPQPAVIDPLHPFPIPYLVHIATRLHSDCLTPPLKQWPRATIVARYRGDDHTPFLGSFRVAPTIDFDWDGKRISNFHTDETYGITHLDYTFHWGRTTKTCLERTGQATKAVTHRQTGATSFELGIRSRNPLSEPAFATPAIDDHVRGSFAADGALRVQYDTDLFPSHGIRIQRDGRDQAVDVPNDASCLGGDVPINPIGGALIAWGLTHEDVHGSDTIRPTDADRSLRVPSPLCDSRYVVTDVIRDARGPLRASAATGSIDVARLGPHGPGPFVGLGAAEDAGLVSVERSPGRTRITSQLTRPIAIRVRGERSVYEISRLDGGAVKTTSLYGPVGGTVEVRVGAGVGVKHGHRRVRPHKPDRRPPRTRAHVTRRQHGLVVRLSASDPSGVLYTWYRLGRHRPRLYEHSLRLSDARTASLRFASVDVLGNVERPRRLGHRGQAASLVRPRRR